ncbi:MULTISPECIES: PH domain-containing protein [unclassified Shewanella]|uniref:PH domain-containing protein n=1 Tax=unclassified Shewanella TaxID=196818 RepID=UPI001BBA2D1C|nr:MULTISPECIES: PH domain-containing protein [unclassified Shewanella]GIU11564.1 hypothetical protein TUM4444_17740 [Shewanella sp. MBTL60-112-B1]GIU31323.1 hypothetical protein TUM4445_15720 [Shewanella sp. MBTL60-112-B2]
MSQVYTLSPLTTTGHWSFVALIAILIGLAVFIYFKQMPKTSKAVSIGILLPMVLAFSWMFYKVNDSKLILSSETLTLDVPFYGFSLPIADIDSAGITLLDWGKEPGLKPDIRANGIGIPGFQLGWFRLANGQKAFVASTNTDKLVLIPTLQNYPLILSLQQPEGLLVTD